MRRFKAQYDKRPVRDGIFPCDKLLPGDGTDPRFDKRGYDKVDNRKALQLCSQVFSSLSLSFAELGNNLLRDLVVESVIPAPDSSQLLVTVSTKEKINEIAEALQGAAGKLRGEIARSINRKRTPQIKFNIRGDSELEQN